MRPRCSLRNRLAEKLLPRPDVNLKYEKIQLATARLGLPRLVPPTRGKQGRQREVVAFLVSASARVEPQWLESERYAAIQRCSESSGKVSSQAGGLH